MGKIDSGAVGRVEVIDAMRGIAAVWVMLYHAKEGGHVDALCEALPSWAVAWLFTQGHLGVPIFFVLSGFVMVLTAPRGAVTAKAAGKALARRLLRLYPPYLLSIVVALVALLIKGGWPAGGGYSLAAHLLFIQGLLQFEPLNGVYWTLTIEIQFYLCFYAVLLLASRFGRQAHAISVTCFACTSALSYVWGGGAGAASSAWFGLYWYAFCAGVLASSLTLQQAWRGMLLVALVAALGGAWIHFPDAFDVATWLAAGLLLVG